MELSLTTKEFEVKLEIDSSDTVYNFHLNSLFEAYQKAAANLIPRLLNHKVSEILSYGAGDVSDWPTLSLERCLFAVKTLIKNYQGSDLYKAELSQADVSHLVCRCSFLDQETIERSFVEAKGDYKKAVLATQASIICSSCAEDVKKIYESLSFKELEEELEETRKKVQRALDEFALFSPPEFEGMVFEVASVKPEAVKIKALNRKEGLGRLKIQQTLENYLGQEVSKGLAISVFF